MAGAARPLGPQPERPPPVRIRAAAPESATAVSTRRDAAAGEHHEETADETDLVQTALAIGPSNPRLAPERKRWPTSCWYAGIRGSPATTSELSETRICGATRGDDLRRAPLVRRIAKTVEIADADRLDPLVAKLATSRRTQSSSSAASTLPSAADPLGHIEAQVARHQRFRQIEIQIIEFVAMLAADLDGVAKTRRGEERRHRALALDQRVGHQGRAMNKRAALTGFYRAVFQRRS